MNITSRRIFVAIPSYRDRECQWTLKDMFEQARHPERVFAGVCWQTIPEEDADCFEVDLPRPDQIRTVSYHCRDARGLGWARREAQQLWRGEEYHLQIDSHMRFVPGWDEKMLAMLDACDSDWPVLTVYPPGYTPPRRLPEKPGVFVQCVDRFAADGMLGFTSAPVPPGIKVDRPLPTACCAGGFQFGASRMLRDCPADPGIYFSGEEPSQAVRLWTHGFDLYSPHETVIYHYYMRKEGSRHWNDNTGWTKLHQQTQERMLQLVEPEGFRGRARSGDLGVYGLGTARSLRDYERFAGISFAGKTIAAFAREYPFLQGTSVGLAELGDDIQPLPETHLFVVGGEGLLFTSTRSEILHLNPSATYVWCLLEDGVHKPAELVARLSAARDISTPQAEAELAQLVAHWRGQGLLAGTTYTPTRRTHDEEPEPLDMLPRYDPSRYDISDRTYRLFDSSVQVRYTTREQEDWIHPVIAHLEIDPGEADPDDTLLVLNIGPYHFVYHGKAVLHRGTDLDELAPIVKYKVLRLAIDRHDHILNLHAGVVAKGDICIALPAVSGSGKTTQTAALIAAGYEYLSDEVALLERGSCRTRPCPVSLCVKESGVDILAQRYPELRRLPTHRRSDGKRVRYLPPPPQPGLDPRARRITHLVFPAYRPGARAQLRPMNSIEGFDRVLEECVAIPQPLTLDDAAVLVDWIEQVKCYELVCDSLEDAAVLMDTL